MKKRIFSLLISLCLLFTLCAIPASASNFSDVAPGSWYAEAVAYCQEKGWMNGTSITTFSPYGTMTRSMLVTALYRQAESPAVIGNDNFTDTADEAWYSKAVLWASQKNIINGYGNGSFGINDPVTREQLVTILWRMAGEPAVGQGEPFSDQDDISAYAVSAVSWAREMKIISGKGDNLFDPQGNTTRAEAAMVLMNYAKVMEAMASQTPEVPNAPITAQSRVLVAYFSATNTTKLLAEYASDILDAALYEIVPEIPYTAEDLDYGNYNSRTTKEQNDPDARPAINGSVDSMDSYDIVFIGYPIWHGQAPRIISTFLESYDFSGKTIIPFCTSHSSGYSDGSIKPLAPDADWITGQRFSAKASRNTVEEWIESLDLTQIQANTAVGVFDFESKTVMLNSGYAMPINGLGTYSLTGETCISSVSTALENGVRLIDTAYMYHNEEEVGQAIRESGIPREEIFVVTKLYPGEQYSNPDKAIQDALDKLDIGYIDMMLLHHPGTNDVKAYKAMEQAVADGKIRSIGLSNWYVEELEEFLPQITITPALVQNEIHPYYQENDVIPYIQSLGIVTQGWYPLGGRGHTSELLNDEVISSIAETHGVSSAQVILRWNLQKGVIVIPGSSNPDHIKENTELYHFELSDDEMAQINALDRNEKHDWY